MVVAGTPLSKLCEFRTGLSPPGSKSSTRSRASTKSRTEGKPLRKLHSVDDRALRTCLPPTVLGHAAGIAWLAVVVRHENRVLRERRHVNRTIEAGGDRSGRRLSAARIDRNGVLTASKTVGNVQPILSVDHNGPRPNRSLCYRI